MKYTAFFILGLIIFLTPYLGITTEWKFFITKFCGAIIVLGVIVRHYYIDSLLYENQTFDENTSKEFADEEEKIGTEDTVDVEDEDEDLDEEDISVISIDDVDESLDEEDEYSEEATSEFDEFLKESDDGEVIDEEDQRA